MKECGSSCRGLEESIFQTPSLLHMTLGTLALMDEVERQKVSEILEDTIKKEIKDQIDDLGSIDVKGLYKLLIFIHLHIQLISIYASQLVLID